MATFIRNEDVSEDNDGVTTISGSQPHSFELGELDMPVYAERTTITIQPHTTDIPGQRLPMPVFTDGWRTTNFSQFIPLSGLDFLIGAEQLLILQTVELDDMLATIESENRYLIKVPRGETLYVATESSSACERTVCGSSRGFLLRLFDHTHQEAMCFRRELACSYCCFGCCLQEMQIIARSGHTIGRIKQEWTLLVPSFRVYDCHGELVYRIEGPDCAPCFMPAEAQFKILGRDNTVQYGDISNKWNEATSMFNIVINFPSGSTDQQLKALILGAAFLLEYMFFETSKRVSCFRSCTTSR
ncbi:phospholipid scramblase 2 [Anabrus simplex]|uniref:phospholipid scramblase 2 n=1 Tax=Anabrus simplex TaxID=316456 RepID=UPI0034DD6FA6